MSDKKLKKDRFMMVSQSRIRIFRHPYISQKTSVQLCIKVCVFPNKQFQSSIVEDCARTYFSDASHFEILGGND